MELEEYNDERSEEHDIYTEEGLDEEEDDGTITAAEQGFMQGYLSA